MNPDERGTLIVRFPDTLPIGLFVNMVEHVTDEALEVWPDEVSWPQWDSTYAEWEEMTRAEADKAMGIILEDPALKPYGLTCSWTAHRTEEDREYDGSGDRWRTM